MYRTGSTTYMSKTSLTTPVSDEGDSVNEAKASDRARCGIVCMLNSRDRFGGNGIVCGSLADLRFTVDGGDGDLERNQGLIGLFTQDLPLACETHRGIPSPNSFRGERYISLIHLHLVRAIASPAPGEARPFLRGDTPREV